MSTSLLVMDVLQQAASSGQEIMQQPSFRISWMGKSLYTISFCGLLVVASALLGLWRVLRGDQAGDGNRGRAIR